MGRAGSAWTGPARQRDRVEPRDAGGDATSRPGAGGGRRRPGPVGRRGWPPSRRHGRCWSRASSRACGSRSRSWSPTSPPSAAGPWRRPRQPIAIAGCSTGWPTSARPGPTTGMGDGTDAAYAAAFREAGIDPDALTPEEAGRRIKARPPEIATAMAMTLDDWAAVRRDLRNDAGRGEAAGRGRPSGRPRPVAEQAPRRPGDRRSHRPPRSPDRPGRFDRERGPAAGQLRPAGQGARRRGGQGRGRVGPAAGPSRSIRATSGSITTWPGRSRSSRVAMRPSAITPPRGCSARRPRTSSPTLC